MAPIVTTIEIARPPREVYGYVTDPTRFAEWQPDVVRVEPAPGNSTGDLHSVGARFATTRRIGGVERTMLQEVTRADPAGGWAARGVDGPIRPHASLTVEPLDEGRRSRVTFEIDFDAHGIGLPLLPLVRRQTRGAAPRSFANLKRLLER